MKKLFIFISLFVIIGGAVYYPSGQEQQNTPSNVASTPMQEDTSDKKKADSPCGKKFKRELNSRVVEKIKTTPMPVDFTTLPEAKTFYTMITEYVASGAMKVTNCLTIV